MKKDKHRRDIKSKLIAAICMLLVSSIMMVSTTYAWFTLSTAPEVTGISTSVGANGSLEMALVPVSGNLGDITTTVGAADQSPTVSNLTWGNLVALQAKDGTDLYGLNKIVLQPADINWAEDATADSGVKVVPNIPLKTPIYGADGRVSSLSANTLANIQDASGTFLAGDGTQFGVRAVGTASAMSQRQLDYRAHRAAASTAQTNATNQAGAALKNKVSVLASMAITHATAKGTDVYTDTELNAMYDIYNAMAGNGGVLDQIETSIKSNLIALVASAKGANSDANYDLFMALTKDGKKLAEWDLLDIVNVNDGQLQVADEIAPYANFSGVNGLAEIITEYKAMVADMAGAKNALDAIEDAPTVDAEGNNTYTWTQMSTAFTYFANADTMVINGFAAGDIMGNLSGFVNKYFETGGMSIEVPEGSGIFSDLAAFCGKYEVNATLYNVKVDAGETLKLDVEKMDVLMKASSTRGPYLTLMAAVVTDGGAPAASSSATATISDKYGYIIDLAFRTNATNAYLQLQTQGVDRIYQDNTDSSAETMGAGSTMTFKGDNGFTNAQVKQLMNAINVVFFDRTSGAIYGIAKLDTTNVVSENEIDGVTAPLYLHAFEIASSTDGKVLSIAADKSGEDDLMILPQNVATSISVMVYLDGNKVENKDVANGATSMTGKMNLQFSTNVPLDPMDYTPLMPQGSSDSDDTSHTVTKNVGETGVTITGAETVADGSDYTFSLTGFDAENHTLTVTVGGNPVTPDEDGGTYTLTKPAGDIVITVAPQ